MSETREGYNVAMQSGRLLDAQVAQVMGRLSDKVLTQLKQRGVGVPDEKDMDGRYVGYSPWENVLRYSTDPAAAMDAWEWLEKHNPWEFTTLLLGKFDDSEFVLPSVYIMGVYWDGSFDSYQDERAHQNLNCIISGDTYPHAISLAVVEAGRALGMIE